MTTTATPTTQPVHELARYLAGDGADYDALRAAWPGLPSDRGAALAWVKAQTDLAGVVFQADPATDGGDGDKPTATWADLDKALGPVTWAWRPWLPNGFLTVLAAEPEKGKSMLLLWLARCVVLGAAWPDGQPSTIEPGRVLWCESEAAQALNLDRAKKFGLPLERFVTPLPDPLEDVLLDNPLHQERITRAASDPAVKLTVVDSLRGANQGDENDSKSMLVVKFLATLARNTGKPVILTHHLRKRNPLDGDLVKLDRVRGSSALMQPARVVWALDIPDLADESNRRLSVIKCNLAKKPDPLGFIIGETSITFGKAPEVPHQETLQEKAADLLLSLLAGGARRSVDLRGEVEAAGVSWAAAQKAKDKLGLNVIRRDGVWWWSLPG